MEEVLSFALTWIERLWWLWLIAFVVITIMGLETSRSVDNRRAPDGDTIIRREGKISVYLGPFNALFLVLFLVAILLVLI